ncbi:hypothetical protein [Streptomyces sp. JH34]|uniref:hypothetical protein n=1 Tax=Streptomyces sp. JH34 TaxID=2793633 RepID=UPI0023F84FB4|nr:hypothetical protein [Streptomyces sp. JH34]MDF6017198.1 hypothetical protein [Streptomyces sp. JH34]
MAVRSRGRVRAVVPGSAALRDDTGARNCPPQRAETPQVRGRRADGSGITTVAPILND